MFFSLSKIFWFLVNPGSLFLLLLCLGCGLLWTPWKRAGRALLSFVVVIGLAAGTLPLGDSLFSVLEDRFPIVEELPDDIHGIVVLGGLSSPPLTVARGQVALNGAVERLTEFSALAKRYKDAKLVFSGGSGDLLNQKHKEAITLSPVFDLLGVDKERLLLEDQSRNTFENAVFSKRIAAPASGEKWLLITSAFHMPRAVGCFRKAGWDVVPYPVDFSTKPEPFFSLSFNLVRGLGRLSGALHEWLGLVFYRLSGRTDNLFPAPFSD
jgi:uncharacterized SAM-binding protein YcdF (DUF218 family)